ncbi:unnamed protein product [Schistosoma turkestanicum]|nr:unnamed protein product [Schistosoma turkestanicum]
MNNNWFQLIYCMLIGFLILTNHIHCMEADNEASELSAEKRFLLALPTPKRLSQPPYSFNRYRRPMYRYGYAPDYLNNFGVDDDDNLFSEEKRFLLGLPPKVEYKRFLLGLPPSSHRHYNKRFILGLPSPTRYHT